MLKQYKDLSKKDKNQAVKYFFDQLLSAVCDGMRFDDKLNNDDLQARIDKAMLKADKMQTPWFAHEYIQDDKKIVEALKSMAVCNAEDILYSDGEVIVSIDALYKK
jgi:hypothetical protein